MMDRGPVRAAVLGLCLASAAGGQVDLEKFERQLEQIQRQTRVMANEAIPVGQRLMVDYGLSSSFGFAAIDDLNQQTHVLRQTTLTGYARADIDGVHEFFVRSHSTYRDFNRGDDFDGHGDDWVEPTLDRATYQFDLQRYLGRYEGRLSRGNLVVLGGRQLVHWANGLSLSEEIDGGQVTVSYEPVSLNVLAGRTRDSIVDLDSSRPGFHGDTKRGFYGAMLSVRLGEGHRPYVYGLVQEDDNDDVSRTDLIGGVPITTRFGYDSWYVGAGSEGRLSDRLAYAVEVVYEGGQGKSSSFALPGGVVTATPQTDEDIQAYAADFRLDYLFNDPNRVRLSGEVLMASGDDDRLTTTNTLGGNRTGTDDRAFNSFGFIGTGLAFSPNVSNLLMLRGGVSVYPFPGTGPFERFEVGVDLFGFNKLDHDAPIDEVTRDHSYLGFETDLYANWRMTSDLSVAVRYGVFFPGQAIASDHDPRHFLFTGVTLAF